ARAAEGDLCGHVSKTESFGQPRAGDAEVLVDDAHLIGSPAERDRAVYQTVSALGRFPVVFDLRGARLAHVDEGAACEMARRKLGRFIHRMVPFLCGLRRRRRLPWQSLRAGGQEARASRFAVRARASTRGSSSARVRSTTL